VRRNIVRAKEADFPRVDDLPPSAPEIQPTPSEIQPLSIVLDHPDAPPRVIPEPDRQTFAEIYETQFGELVRLAGMLSGSTAVAEDVVQDAFAKLYAKFDSVRNPTPYLRRSVLNGCVSRFRKHRSESLVEEHDDGPDGDAEPSERVDLNRRLDRLPDRQRAVVVLRIHLGMTEAEVATILGCRPGTVGSLLHRGLTSLRIDLNAARQ
jgi:RNA polymerase sigma factor (sigma-70 family)